MQTDHEAIGREAARPLEQYLRERIPLAHAMQATVRSANPAQVVIAAPLRPNINHRETVFGGSASAVAILAAWSLVHVRMLADGIDGRIVIRSNTVHYERPITSDFTATAALRDPGDWARLVATLARGRMARIRVAAMLECAGMRVGRFEGEFAVLPGAASTAGPGAVGPAVDPRSG